MDERKGTELHSTEEKLDERQASYGVVSAKEYKHILINKAFEVLSTPSGKRLPLSELGYKQMRARPCMNIASSSFKTIWISNMYCEN